MGMTLESKEPVAVICTSGSAAMNFYPAVAEAFYQKLPLVVITADRPRELIDQGVGQTVRQEGVFGEHILASANLLRGPGDDLSQSYNQRIINEVMLAAVSGPVHINVPFDEPLYDTVAEPNDKIQVIQRVPSVPSAPHISPLVDIWRQSKKVLVLAGNMLPNPDLIAAMTALNQKSPFLVLTESVSNLSLPNAVATIDRLINTIGEEEKKNLQPDLLITMGGEIVSKMIKQFLAEYPAGQHWHLSDNGEIRDTFQQLSGVISANAAKFFRVLETEVTTSAHDYRDLWLNKAEEKKAAHRKFLSEADFSDLTVFEAILNSLPDNSILHSANSASIRYAQLFDHPPTLQHHTNRGTSGIDGCTSTAIGHATVTVKTTVLVTGDVAFLYDSNAFWNDQLPSNLRVVVVNNEGGNIFRIIKGPDGREEFERFQETTHQLNLKAIGDLYGISYFQVDNFDTLNDNLKAFMDVSGSTGPAILEVKTPRLKNPEVLLQYFEFITSNSN